MRLSAEGLSATEPFGFGVDLWSPEDDRHSGEVITEFGDVERNGSRVTHARESDLTCIRVCNTPSTLVVLQADLWRRDYSSEPQPSRSADLGVHVTECEMITGGVV
ncbi:MAG TPA: hypothetical protein VFA04_10510 [Bryobacteraceae bacterium]|nr:hypothetical protein [Bryobacteraceae bacterium]